MYHSNSPSNWSWKKAFDEITRDKLHEAMESIGINPKLRNIIKALYKNTQFET